ncbi:MAG: hypothetical protein Q9211_000005 [Gyalolechia sp. 1 TL-2023]
MAFGSTATVALNLPLGLLKRFSSSRLVEHGPSGGHCPTRYVCLLNVSTTPISVWLMYDYVADDGDIEYQSTMAVYDDSIEGKVTPDLMKTEKLLGGQDLVLLYRDIDDWVAGEGMDGSATSEKGKGETLGPSIRAWTRKPPKTLLDEITVVPERRDLGTAFVPS